MTEVREYGGFDALKRTVESLGRDELRRRHPAHVAAFQQALFETKGDLEQATALASPHLAEGVGRLRDTLTALFDMEYVRTKLAQTYRHLAELADSSEPDAGYWFSYHMDHWTYEADAFVERCKRAISRSVRSLLRPIDPEWKETEAALEKGLKAIKDELGKVRHKLAHGGGGGIDGLVDKWEPILAAPEPLFAGDRFVRESVDGLHNTVDPERRKRWLEGIYRANVSIFAYSEAFCDKVLRRADELGYSGSSPSGLREE